MSKRINSQGFTIIELLIATVVFSVVLLIASTAIIGLSRQFYKGLNKSKTQEVARSISEEIAKNIQYSKVAPMTLPGGPAGTTTWCIANTRYAFMPGVQLGNGTDAVLLRSEGCTTTDSPWDRDANETELIGEGMRLSAFEITSDAQQKVYVIRIKVASGTDDLFDNPTNANAACRNQTGQQFCAVSDFTMTVVRNM